MKKRRLNIIELERQQIDTEISDNYEFLINFQNAILLSLLKEKKITKRQYERCLEIIDHALELKQ